MKPRTMDPTTEIMLAWLNKLKRDLKADRKRIAGELARTTGKKRSR
jgi:hypothetical protein